jgi:hypothetical protein
MWILENTLNLMKDRGMTKEEVLRFVDKIYGATPVKPSVVAPVTPPSAPVVAPVPVQPASLFAKPTPTIDFAKLSKVRYGFSGQQKQDLFKSCVNGRLEDLPILNEAHCLKSWALFKNWNRDYDCLGFQFEGCVARGLGFKEEVNQIEDFLDAEKYDFSGFASWSNLFIATGYTHVGWYQALGTSAPFIAKTFVVLVTDAQSLNQPRYLMTGEDHPTLNKEDKWKEGECIIYLPTAKIDLNRSFKYIDPFNNQVTWFLKV